MNVLYDVHHAERIRRRIVDHCCRSESVRRCLFGQLAQLPEAVDNMLLSRRRGLRRRRLVVRRRAATAVFEE